MSAGKFWPFFPPFRAGNFPADPYAYYEINTFYRSIRITEDYTRSGTPYHAVATVNFNRLNGKPTVEMNADFAANGTIGSPRTLPWVVSDLELRYESGDTTIVIELLDPYTLVELEGDVDAMFAEVDIRALPANEFSNYTLAVIAYNECITPEWGDNIFPEVSVLNTSHPDPVLSVDYSPQFGDSPAGCSVGKSTRRASKTRIIYKNRPGSHCIRTWYLPQVVPDACRAVAADVLGDVIIEPPPFLAQGQPPSPGTSVQGQVDFHQGYAPSGSDSGCPCAPA